MFFQKKQSGSNASCISDDIIMCAIFVSIFILVSKSQTFNDRRKVNKNSTRWTSSTFNVFLHYYKYFLLPAYQPLLMETRTKSEPESSVLIAETTGSMVNPNLSPDSPSKQKQIAEAVDVLKATPGTPIIGMKCFYF